MQQDAAHPLEILNVNGLTKAVLTPQGLEDAGVVDARLAHLGGERVEIVTGRQLNDHECGDRHQQQRWHHVHDPTREKSNHAFGFGFILLGLAGPASGPGRRVELAARNKSSRAARLLRQVVTTFKVDLRRVGRREP